MRTRHRNRWVLSALVGLCLTLCACSGGSKAPATDPLPAGTENTSSSGSRDSTPQVLTPEASGTDVRQCDVAEVDVSNMSEGYIMVNYTGDNAKVKLQLCGPDGVNYTYDLHGGYEVFPLTAGSGNYTIGVYENVSGNQYATALNEQISATIENEFGPYLYPNQYINFTAQSAVMTAMLRSQRIPTRLEVGYMGDVYHAWISIYTKETGWVNGIIEFDGKDWELMDPTFASSSKSPKIFTSENSKYTTKYVY